MDLLWAEGGPRELGSSNGRNIHTLQVLAAPPPALELRETQI